MTRDVYPSLAEFDASSATPTTRISRVRIASKSVSFGLADPVKGAGQCSKDDFIKQIDGVKNLKGMKDKLIGCGKGKFDQCKDSEKVPDTAWNCVGPGTEQEKLFNAVIDEIKAQFKAGGMCPADGTPGARAIVEAIKALYRYNNYNWTLILTNGCPVTQCALAANIAEWLDYNKQQDKLTSADPNAGSGTKCFNHFAVVATEELLKDAETACKKE